jgi:SAM-dependent methyltransferase
MESYPTDNEDQKSFDRYVELFGLTNEDLAKPLLDVGAGSGRFVRFLRDKLGNSHAYGVEKYAGKIVKDNEGMVVADGFRLPFANDTFELVLSKNYLPIFLDNEDELHEAIRELLRVTKVGGKIVFDMALPDIVTEAWEENKKLDYYDEKADNWFKNRYENSKKFLLFLDQLKEDGIKVEVNVSKVVLYK